MGEKIILMPGSSSLDCLIVNRVAEQFKWEVELSHSVNQARLNGSAPTEASQRIVGVLFCRDAAGSDYTWPNALWLMRNAFPGSCLVVCHGFADPIDWPELCDAGAFHALQLPFRESEVRQSFGFIAGAWKAQRALPPPIPISVWPRGLRALSAACQTDEDVIPARRSVKSAG
jgi:hypothetical protein